MALKTVGHSIPEDILDDLSSRFIINVPEEERSNLIRICFQIELAHWFYLDFYCTEEESKLSSCGLRQFAAHIFKHIPFLQSHYPNVDSVLESWREYKLSVPTYGAILLSENYSHVLLVQSYWAKSSWGFPKGKVNEDEDPSHCAAREVFEETGFDISKLINKDDYIETVVHDQFVRLYIIGNISRNTKFQPRTRNEIKSCEWFPLSDLPSNKKDMTPKLKMGVSANSFFMILPFVKRIKKWIFEKTQKKIQNNKRFRHKSMGDFDVLANKVKNVSNNADEELNGHLKVLSIKKEKNTKPNFKRQLFNNNQSVLVSKEQLVFPSWLNFQFNRQAILDTIY